MIGQGAWDRGRFPVPQLPETTPEPTPTPDLPGTPNWPFNPIGGGDELEPIINHIIYELKPNNPRAVKMGLRQLERYLDLFDDSWAGILVLYDR